MPILADIKYQVELQMKKKSVEQKGRPTPREKVMFLTRVLYEKKSLLEACAELSMPVCWGKAIWCEHTQQYNKSKKLYKKSHSLKQGQRTAGVKILPQGQHIGKHVRVRVLFRGQ